MSLKISQFSKIEKINSQGRSTQKSQFQVVKAKNGEVYKIQGISNDNNSTKYTIKEQHDIHNKSSGKILSKQKVYKIPGSQLKNILAKTETHPLQKKIYIIKKSNIDKIKQRMQEHIQEQEEKVENNSGKKMMNMLIKKEKSKSLVKKPLKIKSTFTSTDKKKKKKKATSSTSSTDKKKKATSSTSSTDKKKKATSTTSTDKKKKNKSTSSIDK